MRTLSYKLQDTRGRKGFPKVRKGVENYQNTDKFKVTILSGSEPVLLGSSQSLWPRLSKSSHILESMEMPTQQPTFCHLTSARTAGHPLVFLGKTQSLSPIRVILLQYRERVHCHTLSKSANALGRGWGAATNPSVQCCLPTKSSSLQYQ